MTAAFDLPHANALVGQLQQGVATLLAQQSAHLVGITSGGAWLAQHLHAALALPGTAGVISSTLHRDDFSTRGLAGAARTAIPFDVNGAHIVLIDDVLYTGRTIRAVLNELYDHGRPASVRLAVLVDRGGRQLPIQADCAAHTLPASAALPASRSLRLQRAGDGFALSLG